MHDMQLNRQQVIKLIGYASGIAANNTDCALGAWYLYYHQHLFNHLGLQVDWQKIIKATSAEKGMDVMPTLLDIITELGLSVMSCSKNNEPFCVFGGDHSCAIGTWSAVAQVNRHRGDIGLIWIDAHMDSHTPDTSETQNIHGMPLAHLLGKGNSNFTNLFDSMPAIKPENLCLVGIRSYEDEEKALLEQLGVTVFYMDAVNKQGINTVLEQAYASVSHSTCGVGISLDLDAIDPIDAPGVGCAEPNGISGAKLVSALEAMASGRDFLGLELVEYNPILDINHKTLDLTMALFDVFHKRYINAPQDQASPQSIALKSHDIDY